MPYLPYVLEDAHLFRMVLGVLNRQAQYVTGDTYANAFKMREHQGDWTSDFTHPPMSSHVWEGKYELDSLAAFFKASIGCNDINVFI